MFRAVSVLLSPPLLCPQHLWPMSPDVPFNRHIVNIAKSILEELGANFTAVHIRRGDKVRKASRWPHLDNDTSPER